MENTSRNTWTEQDTIGGLPQGHGGTGSGPSDLPGYEGTTQDYASRTPDSLNPLLPTYFQFSMKRTPAVTYFCQGVNLPGIEVASIEQPTTFRGIPHSPGIPDYDDLTINFIVDENLSNWLEIYNWMDSTVAAKATQNYEKDVREHYSDATLTILNSAMQPNLRVEFHNILPISLSALEFDSTTTTPESLIATAVFNFTTYSITKLS